MFKPHIGDCVECPRKGVIIPVKSGLCQYCNHEKKQRNKSKTIPKGVSGCADEGAIGDFEEGTEYDRNGVLTGSRQNSNGRQAANVSGLRRMLRSQTPFGREQQKNGGDISELSSEDHTPEHGRPSRKMDQATKSQNGKARKPIFKPKKGTGQAEIFAEIAEEREWICFVTQKSLMELTATQFMHVLPKALNKYPLFKLHKTNIQLATNEIHYLWDHTPRSELRKDRRFDKLFALEEQLKNEYKLLKTKT